AYSARAAESQPLLKLAGRARAPDVPNARSAAPLPSVIFMVTFRFFRLTKLAAILTPSPPTPQPCTCGADAPDRIESPQLHRPVHPPRRGRPDPEGVSIHRPGNGRSDDGPLRGLHAGGAPHRLA